MKHDMERATALAIGIATWLESHLDLIKAFAARALVQLKNEDQGGNEGGVASCGLGDGSGKSFDENDPFDGFLFLGHINPI